MAYHIFEAAENLLHFANLCFVFEKHERIELGHLQSIQK